MSYSPTLGRWTSADPTGYADGLSLYEYLRSSPISGVDPSGLQTTQPADPNWNDLKPGDYKGKPNPDGPDAFTGFDIIPIYGAAKYSVKPADCGCGKNGFVATASYPDVKVKARFVPDRSYLKGDPTPELLRHEQFHLRLAKVGAVRAQNALKGVVGTGAC